MKDFSKFVYNTIKENKEIQNFHQDLMADGEDPWNLTIETRWKDVGKIRISSFVLSDFWALRDWWNGSLNYNSKQLFPLFPSNEKLDRSIANHFKNHESRRDLVFNTWLVKEGDRNEDFENEIIGHFFIEKCSDKPDIGLGVSNRFQGKKLGTFFIIILIHTARYLGKDKLYLSCDINNLSAFDLYKRLGFKHIKDSDIYIPVTDFKSTIHDMELDISDYQ
jgi:RimJ/RimL family protein N-acetyltransferase